MSAAYSNVRPPLFLQRVFTIARSFEKGNHYRGAARELANQLGRHFDNHPFKPPVPIYFKGYSNLVSQIRTNTASKDILLTGNLLHMVPEKDIEELLLYLGTTRPAYESRTVFGDFSIDATKDTFNIALRAASPLKEQIDSLYSWLRTERANLNTGADGSLAALPPGYSDRISAINFELMRRSCHASQDYLERSTGERHDDFTLLIAGSTCYQATRNSDIDYLFIRGGGEEHRAYFEEMSRLIHHIAIGAGAISDCLAPALSCDQWSVSFKELMDKKKLLSGNEYMIKALPEFRPVTGIGQQHIYDEFFHVYWPLVGSKRSLSMQLWANNYRNIMTGATDVDVLSTIRLCFEKGKILHRLSLISHSLQVKDIDEWLHTMEIHGKITKMERNNLQNAYDFLAAVNDLFDIKRNKTAFSTDIQNTARTLGFNNSEDFMSAIEMHSNNLEEVLRRVQADAGHTALRVKAGLSVFGIKSKASSAISTVREFIVNGNSKVIFVVHHSKSNCQQ